MLSGGGCFISKCYNYGGYEHAAHSLLRTIDGGSTLTRQLVAAEKEQSQVLEASELTRDSTCASVRSTDYNMK